MLRTGIGHGYVYKKNKVLSQKKFNTFLGPVVGGLVLDLMDLISFGMFGIYLGPFVGFVTGLWLCSIYKIEGRSKWLLALIAAIYCAFPITEFLPLATIISAFVRYKQSKENVEPMDKV